LAVVAALLVTLLILMVILAVRAEGEVQTLLVLQAQEQVALVHQVKEMLVAMVGLTQLLGELVGVEVVQVGLVVTTHQAQQVMEVLELLIQFQVLP
jgi:hypothetical protein